MEKLVQATQDQKANATPHPTSNEEIQFSIKAFRGISVGLGKDEPLVIMAQKLAQQYPHHLVLVQQGKARRLLVIPPDCQGEIRGTHERHSLPQGT